jgi:hypothetical protein
LRRQLGGELVRPAFLVETRHADLVPESDEGPRDPEDPDLAAIVSRER